MVLHQEPSPSEAISPRVARPYIQALHSINLDSLPKQQQQLELDEKVECKEEIDEDLEKERQVKEEPAQIEELNAVMEQVTDPFLFTRYKPKTKISAGEANEMLFLLTLPSFSRSFCPQTAHTD